MCKDAHGALYRLRHRCPWTDVESRDQRDQRSGHLPRFTLAAGAGYHSFHSAPPPRDGPARFAVLQMLVKGGSGLELHKFSEIKAPPAKPVRAIVSLPPSPCTTTRAPRSP